MREILFRGKRKDNSEWIEGFLHIKYFQELPHDRYVIEYKPKHNAKMWQPKYMIAEIDPETIGQYTGLTAYWTEFENEPQEDDVYEHDLLEVTYEDKKVIAEVKFEAGMFILCSNEFADSYIPLFDVVVIEDDYYIEAKKIGNIHDNPELL